MSFRFSAPSSKTLWISIVLVLAGLFGGDIIPSIDPYSIWLILCAYLVLLLGVVFKGI